MIEQFDAWFYGAVRHVEAMVQHAARTGRHWIQGQRGAGTLSRDPAGCDRLPPASRHLTRLKPNASRPFRTLADPPDSPSSSLGSRLLAAA